MPRHTSVVLISVLLHVGAIVAFVLLSILAPDVLPIPRTVLVAWNAPRVVRLNDIPLTPATARKPRLQPTNSPITIAAPVVAQPLVAPIGVTPESDRPGGVASNDGIPEIAEDTGTGVVSGLGTVEAPVAPEAARTPVRLHQGIDAPQKTHHVAPRYPELARQIRVSGVVILEAVIDARGSVESVRVLRSIALLDQAAIDAVREWRFTPARLNGEPIPVVMTVTVAFALER